MVWLVTLRGLVVVVGPSGVGDRGAGAVAEFGLLGAGAQGGGDVGPGGSVRVGLGGEHGEHAFGLVDEAGDQGDGGDGVAEPSSASFGELVEGAVDQVVGVVAAAMIDRLVHHAEVISLKGDSYRLKNRDLGRIPPASHDHGETP